MDTEKRYFVNYWDGYSLQTVDMTVSSKFLASYLAEGLPFIVGTVGGLFTAIKTEQVLTISAEEV